jgi:hypothetical protein
MKKFSELTLIELRKFGEKNFPTLSKERVVFLSSLKQDDFDFFQKEANDYFEICFGRLLKKQFLKKFLSKKDFLLKINDYFELAYAISLKKLEDKR